MDMCSLEKLCLLQIAKDIEFWCGGVDSKGLNGCIYMLGPFDQLGSRQIQELITILAKKKLLKVSYLQSLLHHGVTSIDLSLCQYLVSDTLLQMISRRCQKLRLLAIPHCNKRISIQFLLDLPANLPTLQILDLTECSTCNDNVLKAISQHCKNILVLKLGFCQKVTDHGLEFLNQNKSIVEMNLSGTSCSADGVLMLLKNHRHMQSLSLQACNASSNQQYFSAKFLSLKTTRLRFLDLSIASINDDSVANIAKICPEISALILTECVDITGKSLLHLKTLAHIKHLKLDALNIDCRIHLREFLKECGAHLETLHLIMASDIETGMIGEYCPKLTELTLSGSTGVVGSFVQQCGSQLTLIEACPAMKFLNMENISFSGVRRPHEHFSAIFSESTNQLEVLNISCLDTVDFASIQQFMESACFTNLRSLDVSCCKFVDVNLFLMIVQCCKKLKHLDVSSCWNVHLCDVERAQQIAKVQRQGLKIVWK